MGEGKAVLVGGEQDVGASYRGGFGFGELRGDSGWEATRKPAGLLGIFDDACPRNSAGSTSRIESFDLL